MNETPKVSVCIATYNQARYLPQALQSVLAQTMQDFEIIICDDGSTDNTSKVVQQIDDPRLRYVRHEQNVGIAENRNRCLALAGGEYIAWLDSDDVYHPTMLAVQSKALNDNPQVGLAHSAFEVIDTNGRRLSDWPLPFAQDVIESGADAFKELILANYITAPTVLVRRACHEQAGPYDSTIGRTGTDWEMWLRIALRTDLAYTATPLAQYRQHTESITMSRGYNERLQCDSRVIQQIFHRQWSLIANAKPLQRRAAAALASKALINAGDAFSLDHRLTALSAARQAFSLYPRLWLTPHSWLLLRGILLGNEYAHYTHSKALLGKLYQQLAGTRHGERIRKMAVVNPQWQQTLQTIAQTIRQVTPPDARLLIVDKYDPTLFHLSKRKGWHFPDRQILRNGYPRNSEVAIQHLIQLKMWGAAYLIFPSSAFWWLDFYSELRQHLVEKYKCVWQDSNCVIYQLV